MYQYKYIKASLGGIFKESNHHEIIDKHAKEGWRLVQIVPLDYNGHGKPTDFEIVFEKEVDN